MAIRAEADDEMDIEKKMWANSIGAIRCDG
jgi:hypothetical protein